MTRTFRVLLLSAACSLALQAHAQGSAGPTVPITIPAGDLTSALDTLARQSGTQLVYRSDQLRGARTRGVQAAPDPDAALRRLLQGSGFSARHDSASGAVVIVQDDTPRRAPPARRPVRNHRAEALSRRLRRRTNWKTCRSPVRASPGPRSRARPR
jgi:hypothetical protein